MVACKYPQVRNWETGRCKAPCKANQAVNPETGRCVTKTYLKALHIRGDLGTRDYRSALRDDGITRRDGRSRRSGGSRRLSYGTRDEFSDLGDFNFTEYDYKEPRGYFGYSRGDNIKDLRDMLVDDPDCWPRKRNLATGRCKTPCEPGYAINPRTGGCVTIEYLISIDLYDPYLIEDEEDTMAANLKWFPSDVQTLATHDNADMKRLIGNSTLGVADLKTLRGINQSGPGVQLFGIYSPAHRTACDLSVFRSLIGSNLSNCGLRRVVQFGQPPPLPPAPAGVAAIPGNPLTVPEILADTMNNVGQDFVFITGQVINMATFSTIFAAFAGRDMKIALIDQGGVWRLIHRNTGAAPALPPPVVFQANVSDSKKLAEALDNHWKNSVSVTFHPWDRQTSFDVITST